MASTHSADHNAALVRAELRHISPNDYVDWAAFATEASVDPDDDFGWFVLDIGPEDENGADLFQVLVTTPTAIPRLKTQYGSKRTLLVDRYDPDTIRRTLTEHVRSITGRAWGDIIEQLRRSMYWEYEERWS